VSLLLCGRRRSHERKWNNEKNSGHGSTSRRS
jgi:hypothetical protein